MGNKRPVAHISVAGWFQGVASLATIAYTKKSPFRYNENVGCCANAM